MAEPLSEFDLIAQLFAPMAGEGALGLLDDAALLTPSPGTELVLTKDALVEGVHFFPDDPPASIARKALRVNLSDLAAKGATPERPGVSIQWFNAIYQVLLGEEKGPRFGSFIALYGIEETRALIDRALKGELAG